MLHGGVAARMASFERTGKGEQDRRIRLRKRGVICWILAIDHQSLNIKIIENNSVSIIECLQFRQDSSFSLPRVLATDRLMNMFNPSPDFHLKLEEF